MKIKDIDIDNMEAGGELDGHVYMSLFRGEVVRESYFSTEIACAWQVVEKLRSQGWEMSLSVNHFVTEPWDCRLFLLPNGVDAPERRCIAHGKTAPEAISKAALKALSE